MSIQGNAVHAIYVHDMHKQKYALCVLCIRYRVPIHYGYSLAFMVMFPFSAYVMKPFFIDIDVLALHSMQGSKTFPIA